MLFQVGNRVRWMTDQVDPRQSIGLVIQILPNARGLREFDLYQVAFDFGTRTLPK